MQTPKKVKIQTYCPVDSIKKIQKVIGDAGGGYIGNYKNCSFISEGHGYFMPIDGSNPTIGKHGKLEEVKEMKIEFICKYKKIGEVIEAIKKNHPYEEPAIDIIPLLDIQ